MSFVYLKDTHLIFNVWKEKKIKDIIIPGSKKFNDYNNGSVHAIDDVSISLKDGDRLAIIGHNGAGKSSLLKLIAGIYPPTIGIRKVDGTISSMFELATGFEMEQNGWNNIYLRGLMLGQKPEEIKSKMKEIAEFSELGSFLNMPVKYYSSGMFIRLAFSVSTAIEPDILLLDEVIAAGDAGFLEKANRRMNEMVSTSKILVYVTHNMQSAIDMCNQCVWMERGHILMQDEPKKVVSAYLASTKSGSD